MGDERIPSSLDIGRPWRYRKRFKLRDTNEQLLAQRRVDVGVGAVRYNGAIPVFEVVETFAQWTSAAYVCMPFSVGVLGLEIDGQCEQVFEGIVGESSGGKVSAYSKDCDDSDDYGEYSDGSTSLFEILDLNGNGPFGHEVALFLR